MIWLHFVVYSKRLFDGPQGDPDYVPPPEDRPGGFDWGQGQQPGN